MIKLLKTLKLPKKLESNKKILKVKIKFSLGIYKKDHQYLK